MSNTTDLGIPVTIVFSLCVSRKTVSPQYFFENRESPWGKGRQCLNIVLNNLTLDLAFFLLFLKSGRGEREENSSREKHKIVKIKP